MAMTGSQRLIDDAPAELLAEMGFAAPSAASVSRGAAMAPRTAATADAPATAPESANAKLNDLSNDLSKLSQELERDPAETLEIVRQYLHADVPSGELQRSIAKVKAEVDNPAAALELRQQTRAVLESFQLGGGWVPPAGAVVHPGIIVEPNRHRFETFNDLDGWVVHCAKWWLKQKLRTLEVPSFPPIDPAALRYTMKDQAGHELGDSVVELALFSDFATGEYHSRNIAKIIASRKPHYAIHLGDVYYAGVDHEVESYLAEPLSEILPNSRVFVLNGNHEMLCGGSAFFDYIRDKRQRPMQEQERTYFSLFGKHYAVIAIDTAYYWRIDGEYRDEKFGDWLDRELTAARAQGLTTILLSQHEPIGIGKKETTLWKQIKDVAMRDGKSRVDMWFWGDEHYCAYWDRNSTAAKGFPFHGFCIGNGGYPVEKSLVDLAKLKEHAGKAFLNTTWIDCSAKFPTADEKDNPRPDLYASGYTLLSLAPDAARMSFRNWLGQEVEACTIPRP